MRHWTLETVLKANIKQGKVVLEVDYLKYSSSVQCKHGKMERKVLERTIQKRKILELESVLKDRQINRIVKDNL